MHIGVLTLRFQMMGCDSLKEKRQRLSGLRDRFGRQPSIAVCESSDQDSLHSAEWTFVVAAASRAQMDRILASVETFVAEKVDARVFHRQLEYA